MNVTLSVQIPPGAIGPLVHVCVTVKLFVPNPVRDTLEIFKSAEPQLVIVMLCTALVVVSNWLPKLKVLLSELLPELTQTNGTDGVPLPLRGTMRGLPVASSVMTSWAVLSPVAVGENPVFTLQFRPGAS